MTNIYDAQNRNCHLDYFFLLLLYYLYKIFGSSGQHTGVMEKMTNDLKGLAREILESAFYVYGKKKKDLVAIVLTG